MADTAIPYATKAYNPMHGCTPISTGCTNCWARRMAETRLRGRAGYPADEPFRVTLAPDKLTEPLHWRKPQRVMFCTMGDLLHDDVPDRYIMAALGIVALTPQHRYMLFTKRASRLVRIFESIESRVTVVARDVFPHDSFNWCRWSVLRAAAVRETGARIPNVPINPLNPPWPLPNLAVIVSASTQYDLFARVAAADVIPAALTGLSLEPLVRPIKLYASPSDPKKLGWVIVGCESGPRRRPMYTAWVRSLRDECAELGIPFYLKQASCENTTHDDEPGPVVVHPFLDGRQHTEIPDMLKLPGE